MMSLHFRKIATEATTLESACKTEFQTSTSSASAWHAIGRHPAVMVGPDRLRAVPSFCRDETPEWNREWGTRVDDYYGVPSYWGPAAELCRFR